MTDEKTRQVILVIEDENDLRKVLRHNLTQAGYAVATVPDGNTALEQAPVLVPTLILLDLRLPDIFGLDVLAQLRDDPRTKTIPVIIVSALGDEETVVQGLNAGAEDYVTKPFRSKELAARVASVLRRRQVDPIQMAKLLRCGPITMALDTHEVSVADENVELTKSEFALLSHLMTHANRVFTRQQLCFHALGSGGAVQERTIDAHVRTIRRKLGEAAGKQIVTVWGVGYKLINPLE